MESDSTTISDDLAARQASDLLINQNYLAIQVFDVVVHSDEFD